MFKASSRSSAFVSGAFSDAKAPTAKTLLFGAEARLLAMIGGSEAVERFVGSARDSCACLSARGETLETRPSARASLIRDVFVYRALLPPNQRAEDLPRSTSGTVGGIVGEGPAQVT